MGYYYKIMSLFQKSMSSRFLISFFGIIFLTMIYLPSSSSAHNYSASFTNLEITKNETKMTFSLDTTSVIELMPGVDKNKDYSLSHSELKRSGLKIEEVILESLALDKNNKELTSKVKKMRLVKKQNKTFLSFYVVFPGVNVGDTISLNDGLYSGDTGTTNYVNLLTAKYAGETSTAALQGTERTWTMLLTENQQEQTSDNQKSIQQPGNPAVKVAAPASTSSWLSFFKLGIFHILTGYDHLLFLFALLISRQTLKQYIRTITAFTIAHSITLTMAVLGVADMPSKIVETIIALSICYVAIENIVRTSITYRWIITFFFGLIHGLGFASILKDMNLHKSDLAVALINFNLGIEFIQLIIVLILIPVLMKLQKAANYQNYLRIGSGCIFIVGLIWVVQRIFL